MEGLVTSETALLAPQDQTTAPGRLRPSVRLLRGPSGLGIAALSYGVLSFLYFGRPLGFLIHVKPSRGG